MAIQQSTFDATLTTVQQGAADCSFILGTALMYGGGAILLIMSVVGTISVDIVLLVWLSKQNSSSNSFLTGYLVGSMFSRPYYHHCHHHCDYSVNNDFLITLMIMSVIMTLVAVVLSICLGVPQVGAILIAGWALGAVVCLAGFALRTLGENIAPLSPEPVIAEARYAYP